MAAHCLANCPVRSTLLEQDYGLPLLEAARRTGIFISPGDPPRDSSLTVNGLNLHYLDWGNTGKPPVLFIHGYAQNAHTWDFSALALRGNYHVIAIDLRGHGDSEWSTQNDYSIDAYMSDVEGVIRFLGLHSVTIVGLSLGGTIAYSYAALNPGKVDRLVVVDTGPELNTRGRGRIQRFTSKLDILDSFDLFVARAMKYNPRRPEWQVRGSLRHSLQKLPDGRWTWKYDPTLRNPKRTTSARPQSPEVRWSLWERIKCPTLLVRGGESDLLERAIAERMISTLPNSQMIEVTGSGHLVPGDKPLAFQDSLLKFLSIGSIQDIL